MDKGILEETIISANITLRKWQDDVTRNVRLFNGEDVKSVVLSWLNKGYTQHYNSSISSLGWRDRKAVLRTISHGLRYGLSYTMSNDNGLHINNVTVNPAFTRDSAYTVKIDFPELDYEALNERTNERYRNTFPTKDIEAVSFRAIEQVKFN